MSEDVSGLFVLMDGSDGQQYTLASDPSSSVPLTESLQTVYVTSLLLVEPKTSESKRNRIEQVLGDDLKVEDRLQVLQAMLPPPNTSKKLNQRTNLINSINDKEGSTSDYKCELCGSTFLQPEQYFGHLQTHSGEHTWECSLCPPNQSGFETLSKLRQHEKIKHVDPQLHSHCCPLCPASYERLSQLESHHRRVHIKEKNHVCRLCNKGFYKRSDLRTHLAVHLGLQSRVCEVCGRSFSHVSNLIRHARLHTGVKPYPCWTCGRRFTQLTALEEHRLTHESERPAFPCPVGLCSRHFRSRSIAVRHARRLHPEAAMTDPIPKTSGNYQRRYHCAVCGETFEKASLLHLHESEHQDYSCSSCNETFLSISDLKAHGCSGLVTPFLEDTEGHAPGKHLEDTETIDQNPDDVDPLKTFPEDIDQLQQIPEEIESIEQFTEDIAPDDRISGNSDLIHPLAQDVNTDTAKDATVDQQDISASLESFLMGGILLCVDNGTLKIASSEEFSSDSLYKLTSEGAVMLSPEDLEEAQTVITELPVGGVEEATVSTAPTLSASYLSLAKEEFSVPFPQCPPSLSPSPLCPPRSPSTASQPRRISPPPGPSSHAPSNNPNCTNNVVRIPRLRKCPIPSGVQSKPTGRQVGGTCSECGKHFRKTSSMKQHMGIHFADRQLHRCHMCSHTFAWKSSLNKHLVRHFPELLASQRAFCQDCGKEYLTPAQVHEHLRRDHLRERSHRCQLCPKAFYKKHDLATHMRVHTKEKPYMCETCGKTFTHISHVKRHELIHRGVKRYECDTCKARFRQSSGLKAHLRRHHNCTGSNEIMDELYALVDGESDS